MIAGNIRPLQAATIVSVLSMVYLPLYFAFFFRGFPSASTLHIVSLFSPLIPVMTTLLAIPLLAEVPTPMQWLGVALVALGMVTDWRLLS